MNRNLSLLSFLCIMLAGPAFCSPTWPNEPAGATPLNDWGWDAIFGGGWGDGFGGYMESIASDATAPVSPSNVLQQRFAAGLVGGNGGGGGSFLKLSSTYPEIYWGFSFKLDANFEQHPNGTKLGWIHTANASDGSMDGNQCFLLLQGPQGGPYSIRMDYQGGLDPRLFFNPSAGSFQAGQWVRMEIYWKQSSCNTCHDGKWRWWINGELAGNYTDIVTDRLTASSVSHVTVWGGTGSVKARDSYIWFDHEHVSATHGAPSILSILGSLSSGRTGTPYSATLTASDGKAPFTWFVDSGNLPAGLSLSAGKISGTPTQVGKSTFTIRVTDSNQPALTAIRSFTIVVSGTSAAAKNSVAEAQQLRMNVVNQPGLTSFQLGLPGQGIYALSVCDLMGRTVWAQKGPANAGRIAWEHARTFKEGVYLVRLSQGAHSIAQKIALVK